MSTTSLLPYFPSEETLHRINDFKRYLFELGLHPATIASYVTDVRQFHEYLAGMGEVNAMPPTRLHITRYRIHLLELRLKITTVNKKINSLAAYGRFLQEEGILGAPVVHPRRDRIAIATGSEREVEAFTDEEVTRILFHTQQPSFSLRNRLIVEMLLYTGLRVSELCDIRLADVDFLTSTLKVTGKGGKYREIPLKPNLAAVIRDYLHTERKECQGRNKNGSPAISMLR